MREEQSPTKSVLVIGKNSYIAKSFLRYCKERSKDSHSCQYVIQSIGGKNQEWKEHDFSVYDSVILLAGIVHKSATSEEYAMVNHQMAIQIAKKAKEEQVKQFIFMSTIAVYGDQGEDLDQQSIPNPITEYAKSKYLAEQDITAMQSESFAVAIVRPPMVYGKGCPGNFTKLVKLIQKVHVFPEYQNERSAIYIENLCEFLARIVQVCARGVYVPQDPEYLCSMEIACSLQEKGYRIHLIKGFQKFIQFGIRKNQLFGKVFGNYRYSLKDSMYEEIAYQHWNHEETIKKSI